MYGVLVRVDCGGTALALSGVTPKLVRAGTHRSRPLEHTLDRVTRLAAVMGVTRVANVTGLDPIGIPVVMVCRPNSRSVAVSQGKGLDLLSARVSGLMEAAELYHAETITLPLRSATYEELRYQYNVVDPGELPKSSGSHFHPNLRLLWCEGRNLMDNTAMYVPYELVHTNYTVPLPDGHGCFIASSNGLASGNGILEAISHGICEVVERDATTLWKLGDDRRLAEGRVDLSTIDDPICQDLVRKLQCAGLLVAIWEMTSDIALAVFACVIIPQTEGDMWHASAAAGYGCHPSRQIAFIRAVTEAAQSRLTIISGLRDDFGRDVYDEGLHPEFIQAIRDHLTDSAAVRDFTDVPDWEGETIEDDIERELDCLGKAGVERVIVIDLTKPVFGLSVVRVIIPRLEPMLVADYTPGRRAAVALSAHS